MGPHGLCAPGNLLHGFPRRAQRDEETSDLRGRGLPAHDLIHHFAGLLSLEVAAGEQCGQRFSDHRVLLSVMNGSPSNFPENKETLRLEGLGWCGLWFGYVTTCVVPAPPEGARTTASCER